MVRELVMTAAAGAKAGAAGAVRVRAAYDDEDDYLRIGLRAGRSGSESVLIGVPRASRAARVVADPRETPLRGYIAGADLARCCDTVAKWALAVAGAGRRV